MKLPLKAFRPRVVESEAYEDRLAILGNRRRRESTGRWPADLGPGTGLDYMTNEPYRDLSCSSQHSLAAMMDRLVDVVQPRAEILPYTARCDTVFGKYRNAGRTGTVYPDADKAKISEIGK
jgi:pilus assembly protein CpaD